MPAPSEFMANSADPLYVTVRVGDCAGSQGERESSLGWVEQAELGLVASGCGISTWPAPWEDCLIARREFERVQVNALRESTKPGLKI